jgi:hypothetical protein
MEVRGAWELKEGMETVHPYAFFHLAVLEFYPF